MDEEYMDMDDIDLDEELVKAQTAKKSKDGKAERMKTWVEKYRPAKLEDVVYQHEVVAALKNILLNNSANLPNLLLYGPPGTGKTSTVVALSKELFGDSYNQRVLELNASDDRGIQVVREKVKNFAMLTLSQSGKNNLPPIKIVVLDECDSMTRDAQSALRRTMEKYSKTTRFCLICNYVSRIIDPIVSRCSVFRFKPLQKELVEKALLNICTAENFEISEQGLQALINVCEGDLRRSITLLQASTLITEEGEPITEKTIFEISGFVPHKLIVELFNLCRSKLYKEMVQSVDNLVKDGYSGTQFLAQLQHFIASGDEAMIDDKQKSRVCQTIGMVDKRLLDGADEFIQLLCVGSTLIEVFT